jgi:transposase
VRIVDPLATHQYRKAAHAGTKTDDIDLEAIHRAAIHGFGLATPALPPVFGQLQVWARHRRDLVFKTSRLRCQIQEHLHSLMPGYAELFDDLFLRPIGLFVPLSYSSAAQLRAAGLSGLRQAAAGARIRCLGRTLETIVAWAGAAPEGDAHPEIRQAIVADLVGDYEVKRRQIAASRRPSSPPRWGRSVPTPAAGPLPDARGSIRRGTKAVRWTSVTARWCGAATAGCAWPSSRSPTP